MPMTVVGVAKDIHYVSAREKIGKLVYTAYRTSGSTLGIKYAPGKYQQAKTALSEIMNKHYQGEPYSPVLMRDIVNNQYWQDEITSRILICGTVLAILLALLGLVALMGFVAQQKRKEISLRRVMGAQVKEIVYDLNRYIILRILPAVPIGLALSYYMMSNWLQNFAYTIPLSWWIFAGALVVTLLIVLITIFYQSIHSATANPVNALKSE